MVVTKSYLIRILILQACAKFNIHCLDPTKILDGTKDFYKYDNHPNSMGTEKIANFLYKKLIIAKITIKDNFLSFPCLDEPL